MSFDERERVLAEVDVLLRSHERTGINPFFTIAQLVTDVILPLAPEPPKPAWREFSWPESRMIVFNYAK